MTNKNQPKNTPIGQNKGRPILENYRDSGGALGSNKKTTNVSPKVPLPSVTKKPPSRK